jgi:hypothetical protein
MICRRNPDHFQDEGLATQVCNFFEILPKTYIAACAVIYSKELRIDGRARSEKQGYG